MRLLLRIAAQNLLQGGRRVALLGAALAFSTLFLVLVTALFSGVSDRLTDAGTAIQSGDINIAGIFQHGRKRLTPAVVDAYALEALVREGVPEVSSVALRHSTFARITSDTRVSFAWIQGVDIANEPRLREVLTQNLVGAGPGAGSRGDVMALAHPHAIALFASQAKKLNVDVGDRVTLWAKNMRGVNNSVDATVVAVMKDLGGLTSFTSFMDFGTCEALAQLPTGSAGSLAVYLRDRNLAQDVMLRLHAFLKGKGMDVMPYVGAPIYSSWGTIVTQSWQGQRVVLNTWTDQLRDLAWRVTAAQGISALLALILVVVIGIGIMNSMLVTVQQRTREIGTLRALGMSRLKVVGMFVAEGTLLGAVSAGTGATLGAGAAKLLDSLALSVDSPAFRDIYFSDVLGFSVSFDLAACVALLFVVVAAVSSIWPALRAAGQRPAVAIRSSG